MSLAHVLAATTFADSFGVRRVLAMSRRAGGRAIATMLLPLAAIACAPLTTAEAEHGPTAAASGMNASSAPNLAQRPLDADALRALLSDVYVTEVLEAGVIVDHPPGEVFMSDGRYMRILTRTRQYGTFDIRDNLVCIKGQGFVERCRRVVFLGNGTYALVDAPGGQSVQVTITPRE